MNKDPFFANCKHLSPWSLTGAHPRKVVVTCFLQKGDKVLVLQRGRKDAQFELWGIPGGKLHASESPLKGLQREILEETGAFIPESSFTFFDAALSKTSTDGQYELHLYHAEFPNNLPIINPKEHLAFQWVTLEEFEKLPLLHAQREAFEFVHKKLHKKINQSSIYANK